MVRPILAILDNNEDYLTRLRDSLERRNILPFTISVFSDTRKFRDYRCRCKVDVCLVTEEMKDKIRPEESIRLLVLSEEKGNEGDGRIFRYCSVETLAEKILKEIGISPERCLENNSEKDGLIAVYSPLGRCLKTSFALVLGQILARSRKVLYLNFESYSGFSSVMGREMSPDMSDLIYCFKNLEDEFDAKFDEICQSVNGLDFIPPAMFFTDIYGLTEEEWMAFIERIRARGRYDYIILDLSDYVHGLFELLRKCGHVYMMERKDGVALAKISQYEEMLKAMNRVDILEKTRKFNFPVFKKLPAEADKLLYSELADYVKKIVKEDFTNR